MLRLLAPSILVMTLTQFAFASSGDNHAPPAMPKEFDTLKGLVGTWEGFNKMGGEKDEVVTVVYALTSGGTAITETLMPGTSHEMTSIYHKEGKSLAMTHYCAMGNQPHLVLKKAEAKSMEFELIKPIGISSLKESHMHALTLTMADSNSLSKEWISYSEGKKSDVVHLNFKRKLK